LPPRAAEWNLEGEEMDFRRSGQLDERRRRVLMDEIASPTSDDQQDAPTAASSAKGPVRAYCPAVLNERQLRLTDLILVRPMLVAALLLLGLTGIATVEAIHIHAATLPLKRGAAQLLAALDATARGSLVAWYSSLLLLAATALALIVFAIRAHRVDDYRGRYRIWLWAAAALAWLSLDAATGLHDAIGLGLALAAGRPVLAESLPAACTVSWLALYGLVLGTLGIRLAIEVWPSLPSFAALLLAGLLYLVGGLMQLEMLPAATPLGQSVAETTVALLAHWALAAAVGLFARHVYLDATGRLKVHIDPDKRRASKSKGRAKLKVVKEASAAESNRPAEQPAVRPAAATSEPARFGAASTAARPGASISKSSLSAPKYGDDDEDEEDASDYGGEKLSRSERRRLKKLARQNGQRRAA
jgi:hypothetical protein